MKALPALCGTANFHRRKESHVIYEIRTYQIAPGSLAEVEKRFGDAYQYRKKYSELTAFLHTEVGPLNEIVHIWGYKDLADRARVRGEASKEANWPPKIQEFIRQMRSEIAVPFSFIPEPRPGTLGPVYELRYYTLKPGTLPDTAKGWESKIGERAKLSPIVSADGVEFGGDIGGTFTDLVALDETTGAVVTTKALSTPRELLEGVLSCVDQAGVRLADCRFVIHGTTIGINALLELKGARTGLITTEGFRDVLEIGRGNFLKMYDVLYRRPEPLVPRGRSREVPERLSATGEVLVPLDEEAVRAAARQLLAAGVESVAVVFLFSYRDPAHEQRAAQIVAAEMPGVSVSASHRITQEWREYERTSTTVVNAYVQPVMDRYLGEFGRDLGGRGFRGELLVTQSNGGAFSLEAARSKPVHTIESGPAAGVTGSASLSRILGADRLISFDMGGTTAKCAIVERGLVQTTDE